MKPELLARGLQFPEGPVFAPDGALWWVEIEGGCLARFQNGEIRRFEVDGRPNGLAWEAPGRWLFCDQGQHAVRRFLEDGATEMVCHSVAERGCFQANDLAFDGAGNLVFTVSNWHNIKGQSGFVGVLPRGGEPKIIFDHPYTNGLAFVDGGKSLVVADTARKTLWKGAWDAPTATWSELREWAKTPCEIGPDGMALGENGLLYVAAFGGGCLYIVAPDGSAAGRLELAGKNPTNCAFDPSGELGLVVTEAERGELLAFPEVGRGAPLFHGGDAVN